MSERKAGIHGLHGAGGGDTPESRPSSSSGGDGDTSSSGNSRSESSRPDGANPSSAPSQCQKPPQYTFTTTRGATAANLPAITASATTASISHQLNSYNNVVASSSSSSGLFQASSVGAGGGSGGSARLPNPPSFVEHGRLRFLIMDAPSENNIHLYLREMEKYGVTDVVRVCDPTYPREILEKNGIRIHDWIFPDGEGAPEQVVSDWLNLVDRRFFPRTISSSNLDVNPQSPTSTDEQPQVCIATHCVAGLGRAPVLVAIALIEYGMSPLDAILFIREKRRGAINNKQLKYLENYRPRRASASKCLIA